VRASVLAIVSLVLWSDLTASQPLELQAMCAAQAQKAFQEWENESREANGRLFGNTFTTISSGHQSHYNMKLKRCLLLIEEVSELNGQIATSANLIDAFERRLYASFLWVTHENKYYWEVSPIECELAASYRQRKNCTTREEFDSFVAEYMEE
jgi:hypothetical protein